MSATGSRTFRTGMLLAGSPLAGAGPGMKADLIYLGSEFCQNLLPGPAAFARARALHGRPLVLVTPLLTDKALDGVEAVLRKHARRGARLEVVANDLGLIRLVSLKYRGTVSLSLGTVLGDFLAPSGDDFLRRFLAGHGIVRFEADSPGLLGRYSRFGLPCSYHIPYSHMAVTRYCPWEGRWADEKCRHSCAGKGRALREPRLRAPLRLLNCGYFAGGGLPPGGSRADRIVYSPSVTL